MDKVAPASTRALEVTPPIVISVSPKVFVRRRGNAPSYSLEQPCSLPCSKSNLNLWQSLLKCPGLGNKNGCGFFSKLTEIWSRWFQGTTELLFVTLEAFFFSFL